VLNEMKIDDYTRSERRKFVRIPFWFVTKYRLYPHKIPSGGDFRQGIGKNISTGGICFEAKDEFAKGSLLEIEIDMPALEHAVPLIGEIAWSRKQKGNDLYVIGMSFKKIDPEDFEAVKKIIDTFA